MQQTFLLQILLLPQHVLGTTMPIIKSLRVFYSGCCLWQSSVCVCVCVYARARVRERERERERERKTTFQYGPKPMLSNRSPVTEEHHDSNMCLLLYTILTQWNPIDSSYYNNMKVFTKVLECQEAEILLIFCICHTKSLVSPQPMDTSSPEECICQCYTYRY